jgi:hypothetical protein
LTKNITLSINGSTAFHNLSITLLIIFITLSRKAYFFYSNFSDRSLSRRLNGFNDENIDPIFLNGDAIPFPIFENPDFIPEPIDFIPFTTRPTPVIAAPTPAPTPAIAFVIPNIVFEPTSFVRDATPDIIDPIFPAIDNMPDYPGIFFKFLFISRVFICLLLDSRLIPSVHRRRLPRRFAPRNDMVIDPGSHDCNSSINRNLKGQGFPLPLHY